MAIVKAPLFSLGAKGKLGDSLVYSSWKGVNTARVYTVPANPKTTAQIAQRDILTQAVDTWQVSQNTDLVKTAWNVAASNSGKPQSGFNLYVSHLSRLAKVLGDEQSTCGLQIYSGSTASNLSLLEEQEMSTLKPSVFTHFADGTEGTQLYFAEFWHPNTHPSFESLNPFTSGKYYQFRVVEDGVQYNLSGVVLYDN
jgi:hypothetical protein